MWYEYMESCVESVVKPDKIAKPEKEPLSKKKVYKDERETLVKKLDSILGFTETNRSFCVDTLKDDEEKQKNIIGLETDVRKYFSYSQWPYFTCGGKKKYLSLLKSIYKDMDYKLEHKAITLTCGKGYYKSSYKYTITK